MDINQCLQCSNNRQRLRQVDNSQSLQCFDNRQRLRFTDKGQGYKGSDDKQILRWLNTDDESWKQHELKKRQEVGKRDGGDLDVVRSSMIKQ